MIHYEWVRPWLVLFLEVLVLLTGKKHCWMILREGGTLLKGREEKQDLPKHISEIPKDQGYQQSTCYFSKYFEVWGPPTLTAH